MDYFINTRILFDPINWLVVVFVLIFVGYGAFAVANNAGITLPQL
jgi:hypothetical protein